jgi:transcription antitermination factor NusG
MNGKWIAIQLPLTEEGISEELLRSNLIRILPNIEIFIPTLRVKDRRGEYVYSLFDGYAFATGPYNDLEYLQLENSPYVQNVLCVPGSKKIAWITDIEIEKMKHDLLSLVPSKIQVGKMVDICGGLFKGLHGKILEVIGGVSLVEVYMPMGSLTKLTRISNMFLKGEDDS